MMKKILFACSLLLISVCAATGAFAAYNVDSAFNPVKARFYRVFDGGVPSTFRLISTDPANGSTSSTGDISGYCYGLAVSPDGNKLYLSISNGGSSVIGRYDLDSTGKTTGALNTDLNFNSYTASTGNAVAPRGIALVNNYLYVADSTSAGVVHLFDLSKNQWIGTLNIKADFGGSQQLHSVAVSPVSGGKYTVYVSSKSGSVYVYTATINGDGSVSHAKSSSISALRTPTYLKVRDGKLYVAVKYFGTYGDIKVFNADTLSLIGTVYSISEGASGSGFGWTGFDLSPDGKYLYYTQAQDATETSTKIYKIAVKDISGTVQAVELAACTHSPVDSLLASPNRSDLWAIDSGSDSAVKYDSGENSVSVSSAAIEGMLPPEQSAVVAGKTYTIVWNASSGIANVDIQYAIKPGDGSSEIGEWKTIASNVANPGTYSWDIPTSLAGKFIVLKVSDSSAPAVANNYLAASYAVYHQLQLTAPDGGERVPSSIGGKTYNITWDTAHDVGGGFLFVYYTTNYNGGDTKWTMIKGKYTSGAVDYADGSLTWDVPDVPSTNCRVKIVVSIDGETAGSTENRDSSDSNFTIYSPDITPPDPVTGLTAKPGASAGSVDLAWTAPGDDDLTGTVSGYQVRYMTSSSPISNPFTNANFADTGTAYSGAADWAGLISGGKTEHQTMSGIPLKSSGPTYIWIAIKAFDDAGNIGALGYHSTVMTLVRDNSSPPSISRIYPRRAPQSLSTNIVIEGQNFASASFVDIQSSPATALTVTSLSASKIIATVPSGITPGTYHITVTTGGGISAQTAADTFEVTSGKEDPIVCPQVGNLTATAGDQQVSLGWTNPADNDMAIIEVRRYTGNYPANYTTAGYATILSGIPKPNDPVTLTDKGTDTAAGHLTNGTPYYYVVFIKDTSGNWSVVQIGKNAATATPGGGGTGAISNLNIVRNGDTAGSSVTVSWQTNPTPHAAVKIYTRSGDFSTSAADWTEVNAPAIVAAGDLDTYTDNNQVGSGTAKYYKIVTAALQNSDLTAEVAGKFDLHVTEGSNLVALTFVPADTNIGSVIGNQLTGGTPVNADKIYYYDSSVPDWKQAYLKTDGSWSGTLSSLDSGKGYFINVGTGNPAKDVTLVGTVFSGTSLTIALYKDSNLVSSPYPTAVPLEQAGLPSVLTGGTPVNADKIYYWDNATQGWLQAYIKTDGTFQGTLASFAPGKGYYINNQALASDPQPDAWKFERP